MFKFRTQRRRAPFWLVELPDVFKLELKNAVALDLLARVRTETIRMGINEKKRQLTHRKLLEFPYIPDPNHNHTRRSALAGRGKQKKKRTAYFSVRLFDGVNMNAGFVGFTLKQPIF